MSIRFLIFFVMIFGALLEIAHSGTLSSYPATATLQNGDIIPVVISASNTNGTINWYSLNSISVENNTNINWTDVKQQQFNQGATTGINWNDINPVAGGINWMVVTKAASDNTILCVKNGQPGKCSSSFNSTGAGSCICI